MQNDIQPIQSVSLKEACVDRLERLILSGELQIGEQLPAERDFAARLKVSRPVLHAALVDLDAKGLVRIEPRRGVFVNDYRRSGSMAVLASLLNYNEGQLDPAFIQSLIDMRQVIETETARLAARNRSAEQLVEFHALLAREQEAAATSPQALTELDFSFHLSIAIASGNRIYPLIINSFKNVYTHLTGEFFRKYAGTPVVASVHHFHVRIVSALEHRDAQDAVRAMGIMLKQGEAYLKE